MWPPHTPPPPSQGSASAHPSVHTVHAQPGSWGGRQPLASPGAGLAGRPGPSAPLAGDPGAAVGTGRCHPRFPFLRAGAAPRCPASRPAALRPVTAGGGREAPLLEPGAVWAAPSLSRTLAPRPHEGRQQLLWETTRRTEPTALQPGGGCPALGAPARPHLDGAPGDPDPPRPAGPPRPPGSPRGEGRSCLGLWLRGRRYRPRSRPLPRPRGLGPGPTRPLALAAPALRPSSFRWELPPAGHAHLARPGPAPTASQRHREGPLSAAPGEPRGPVR